VAEKIVFECCDFKGSRYRCLLATHMDGPRRQSFLGSLVSPFASVGPEDLLAPRGYYSPNETALVDGSDFLTAHDQSLLRSWWLKNDSRYPSWDIASTCTIGGRKGLLLVEAKAHSGEIKENDCCKAKDEQNCRSIVEAVAEASRALSESGLAWSINTTTRYQLSNRFAWAWKIASLGTPVVLVFLGFLNSTDWPDHFRSHDDWRRCLLNYTEGFVPQAAWETSLDVNGVPFIPLIRSADVNVALG
jgi:hypothetical protein